MAAEMTNIPTVPIGLIQGKPALRRPQCGCTPVFRTKLPNDVTPTGFSSKEAYSIIVVGASGDLAKKKLFPALLRISYNKLIPEHAQIIGYSRTHLPIADFRKAISAKFDPNIPKEFAASFLDKVHYVSGEYSSDEDFARLDEYLKKIEGSRPSANRAFYFSIPPSIFTDVAHAIKRAAMSSRGWNRIVVEKPFGRDFDTSAQLQTELMSSFQEEQVFRIDHYLGKEMVLNLLTLRFANSIFEPMWNRNYISSVVITFKEDIGTEGRGGYFDNYGIIRDVMQNHLLQVMALVAMEAPVSLSAEDIRNEKVKVLQCIPPICHANTVIGQYESYRSETGVPKNSVTPTFATCRLCIQNQRWAGVPFVLKCGKGLNERKAEIRIQFTHPNTFLFENALQNELVIRIQPNEAIYMKMMAKEPGIGGETLQTELDLTYHSRFKKASLPDAYEHLLRDVLRGDHSLFVRGDELSAAWRIFTPLLQHLESTRGEPIQYKWGSRGPTESDDLLKKVGFVFNEGATYKWPGSPEAH